MKEVTNDDNETVTYPEDIEHATGFLIGKNYVLTCAHFVIHHETKTNPKTLQKLP